MWLGLFVYEGDFNFSGKILVLSSIYLGINEDIKIIYGQPRKTRNCDFRAQLNKVWSEFKWALILITGLWIIIRCFRVVHNNNYIFFTKTLITGWVARLLGFLASRCPGIFSQVPIILENTLGLFKKMLWKSS